MILPPYPFPEKWAALAQRREGGDPYAHRWLSPFTPLSQYVGHTETDGAPTTPRPPPAADRLAAHMLVPALQQPTHVYSVPKAFSVAQHEAEREGEEEEEEQDEDGDSDGDYEYGYVLRDEWRQYLRETVLSDDDKEDGSSNLDASIQPRRKRQEKAKKNKTTDKQPRMNKARTKSSTTPVARLTTPLELALDDARALEKQRQCERAALASDRSCWQTIHRLETALHAQFEAFCDRHAPTVWPQGAS